MTQTMERCPQPGCNRGLEFHGGTGTYRCKEHGEPQKGGRVGTACIVCGRTLRSPDLKHGHQPWCVDHPTTSQIRNPDAFDTCPRCGAEKPKGSRRCPVCPWEFARQGAQNPGPTPARREQLAPELAREREKLAAEEAHLRSSLAGVLAAAGAYRENASRLARFEAEQMGGDVQEVRARILAPIDALAQQSALALNALARAAC